MAKEQIHWDSKWWNKWQENPEEVARQLGWGELPQEWKTKNWKKMNEQEGKELFQNSRWGSWFWWG